MEVERKSIIKTGTTSYSEKFLETDRKEEIGHFKINLLINSNYIFNMEASGIHKIIEADILKGVYHYIHCLLLHYGKKRTSDKQDKDISSCLQDDSLTIKII